jgi:hypothetical protein
MILKMKLKEFSKIKVSSTNCLVKKYRLKKKFPKKNMIQLQKPIHLILRIMEIQLASKCLGTTTIITKRNLSRDQGE